MPPIPIYSDSPINAAKPDGVTPKTAATSGGDASAASHPAGPVTASSQQPHPHLPQPGAVPSMPAPTGTASSSRYAPLQPTPTQPLKDDSPPPPQPGAVPHPLGVRSTLPPPPKAGETYHPPEQTAAPRSSVPYPPQMGIPPPTMPYNAARTGTSSAFPGGPSSQTSGPIGVGFDSHSHLEHPAGYHQNVSAADFSSHQRASHYANVSDERRRGSASADGDEGVWDSAKKLVQVAGEKLSAAETEVWRRINKE